MKHLFFIVTAFILTGCASVDNKENRVPAQTADFGKTNFSSDQQNNNKMFFDCIIEEVVESKSGGNGYYTARQKDEYIMQLSGKFSIDPNLEPVTIYAVEFYQSRSAGSVNQGSYSEKRDSFNSEIYGA